MARRTRLLVTFALALALALVAGVASAQDAKTVIQSAQQAMGKANSIQYSGTGTAGGVGQNWNPNVPWHATIVTKYTRTIDYVNGSSSEDITRTQKNPPDHGGEAPFAGEQNAVTMISGDTAWNKIQLAADLGSVGMLGNPAPAAAEERQLQIL